MKKRKSKVSKNKNEEREGMRQYTDDEAKAFVKALLQRALADQVELHNLEIKDREAMVAQIGQASSFLIYMLAQEAHFDHDSEVARRARGSVMMTDCDELDEFLYLQVSEIELERTRLQDEERNRLSAQEREIFTRFTGRTCEPSKRVEEAEFIIGRRRSLTRAESNYSITRASSLSFAVLNVAQRAAAGIQSITRRAAMMTSLMSLLARSWSLPGNFPRSSHGKPGQRLT
jgi:hypothetical protein